MTTFPIKYTNQVIHGKCVDYTHDGQGIIKYEGLPIFVSGLLIDETADVEIIYQKKDFLVGKLVKLHQLSKDRIKPLCPIATACGGCCFQNLAYPAQLDFKKKKVEEAFRKIAQMNVMVDDTVGMENPYYYRNKTQMPFGVDRRGKIVAGFYKAKTHDIVPLETCYIENKSANGIIATIKKLMKEIRVAPYDEDARTGIIRHVLIRASYYLPQIMVVLVTNVDSFPGRNNFVKELHRLHPEITTIVQNINTRDTNVILGEKENVLMGRGFIQDTLCGVSFQISSKSFYQINPTQTEKMYTFAIEKAHLTGEETVLDAYCGIGTIALIAAKNAKKMIGVEVIKEAINDARKNAVKNNIHNAEFVVGDAGEFMMDYARTKAPLDVVFMDPPRKGADQAFIDSLLVSKPKRIVYVSCDPATLARDVKLLSTIYRVESVTPFDLFPMTFHVETVVQLQLKDK